MAFIEGAKKRIAENHEIALDRDPAEVMKENNRKLHEAAMAMTPKKPMVKQVRPQKRVVEEAAEVPQQPAPQPVKRQPILKQEAVETPTQSINDRDMQKVGYDNYMQAMMNQSDDNEDQVELSEIVDEPDVELEQPTVPQVQPVQQSVQQRVEMPRQRNAEPPRQSQSFAKLDVTNFADVRGLPSEGLLYDAPILGQSLTLMDVLMMSNMDSENITETINTLFLRRLRGGFAEGFDPENILACDEAYLMHWLRASTIDTQLPYSPPTLDAWEPFKCPDCNGVAKTQEDYSNLVINFNNLDFKIHGDLNEIIAKHANGCYTFELYDQRQCDVYLRRRYHETMINDTLKLYQKDMGKEMSLEMQQLLRTAVVVEIEGIDNIVDKLNYIGNMGYKAAKHFIDEVDGASLRTDITANVICPFCKKEVTIPYPFRLDTYLSSL
jgi:hypothetical protein